MYKIQLIVSDNKYRRNIYYIDVEVKGYDGPPKTKEDPPSREIVKDLGIYTNCTAKIISIDQFGRMKIAFKVDSRHLDAMKKRNLQSIRQNS